MSPCSNMGRFLVLWLFFDVKGLSLGHVTKMSLSSIKKYYMYIQVQMKFVSCSAVTHVVALSTVCFLPGLRICRLVESIRDL
jgi:hypothetical protein